MPRGPTCWYRRCRGHNKDDAGPVAFIGGSVPGWAGYHTYGMPKDAMLDWAKRHSYGVGDLFGGEITLALYDACVDRYYWDYFLCPEENRDLQPGWSRTAKSS